jgi:spore germination protein PC
MAYQQPFDLNTFIMQTHQAFQSYQKRIQTLEATIDELKSNVDQLKSQEPITINYKFDQLKIEKLEGTLNIGMSPGSADSTVDAFEVGAQSLETPFTAEQRPDQVFQTPGEVIRPEIQPATQVVEAVKGNMETYFQEQALIDLKNIESKYQYPLDDPYRQFILNDVKRQLPSRLEFYLKMLYREIPDEKELITQITYRLRTDIVKAFDLFIQHLPKGNKS